MTEYFDDSDRERNSRPRLFEDGQKYHVCPVCDGEGKYVNPAIDSHGISAEEFAEDPDFQEAYFRGDYDVTCKCCKGARVVTPEEEDEYFGRLDMHREMMAEQGERYGDIRL